MSNFFYTSKKIIGHNFEYPNMVIWKIWVILDLLETLGQGGAFWELGGGAIAPNAPFGSHATELVLIHRILIRNKITISKLKICNYESS